MNPSPDFTDFTQILPDQTAVTDLFADVPPSVASAPPNLRSQSPRTLFLELPMGAYSTQVHCDATLGVVQDPYLPLPNASHSLHIPPPTAIASLHNNVHSVQWNENDMTDPSSVGLTWSAAPVVPQPILPLSPLPSPRWFEVPQRIYEHGYRQWDFKQSEPISFSVNGLPGINMEKALHKQFTGLDGRDDPMFQNAAKAISCRFLFPGYPNGSAQIPTLGWAKDRVPITRSKLAYEVAKKLNQYLESMAGHPMDGSIDDLWKIGAGFMHLKNMFLTTPDLSAVTDSFDNVFSGRHLYYL